MSEETAIFYLFNDYLTNQELNRIEHIAGKYHP